MERKCLVECIHRRTEVGNADGAAERATDAGTRVGEGVAKPSQAIRPTGAAVGTAEGAAKGDSDGGDVGAPVDCVLSKYDCLQCSCGEVPPRSDRVLPNGLQ